jgi:hypothetical protein
MDLQHLLNNKKRVPQFSFAIVFFTFWLLLEASSRYYGSIFEGIGGEIGFVSLFSIICMIVSIPIWWPFSKKIQGFVFLWFSIVFLLCTASELRQLVRKRGQQMKAEKEVGILSTCIESRDLKPIASKQYSKIDFGEAAAILKIEWEYVNQYVVESQKVFQAFDECKAGLFSSPNNLCDYDYVLKLEESVDRYNGVLEEQESVEQALTSTAGKRLRSLHIKDLFVRNFFLQRAIDDKETSKKLLDKFFTIHRAVGREIKNLAETLIAAKGKYGTENGDLVFYDDEYLQRYNENVARLNRAFDDLSTPSAQMDESVSQSTTMDSKVDKPMSVETPPIQRRHLSLTEV